MQNMIALMSFPYGGRELRVGDRFEALEKDAFILRGTGRARDAQNYKTAALKAEDSATPPIRTKRKYKRRDMQASA